jgi:hemerythrin-like domain-containing protein
VDHSIEDYNLLVMGNQSLLCEHNELKCRCEDLQATLVEAHSDTKKRVVDLEAKVKSVEDHGEKHLRDFKDGLVRKLKELRGLYVGNVQTIGGLCSQLPTEEP